MEQNDVEWVDVEEVEEVNVEEVEEVDVERGWCEKVKEEVGVDGPGDTPLRLNTLPYIVKVKPISGLMRFTLNNPHVRFWLVLITLC